jgi:hypothetical protein
VWRCGIGPRIAERLERCASLANSIERIEEIARRSRQPIELADHQAIALSKRSNGFG